VVKYTHTPRYLFSPQIKSHISSVDATLGLSMCCITYLSQAHHNPEITNEDIARAALLGLYRLHDYAMNMWLKLLVSYLTVSGSNTLQNEMVRLLERLVTYRSNDKLEGAGVENTSSVFSN